MSILNVNTIQPVGSGQTITVSAANISASSTVVTASSFVGNVTGTVNSTGIITATSFSGSGSGLTGIVNSGITTVAAGTAAAPSISPTGDSNTGIFFPSADTVAIAEGGVEALRVDSNGNLGIGTTNPTSRLEIGGNSSSEALVTFNRVPVQTTNGGIIGELFFQNNADSVALISVKRESAADDAYIQFATQQTSGGLNERLRITSAGTLESYSPDDTTPNIKWRSNDTNWFGSLNQSVEGGTITSFLSCGGDWSANGTTYSATKALAAYPTSAIAVHNQYNSNWGSEFVFLTKAGGSSTTDGAVSERLRITSGGNVQIANGNLVFSTAGTGIDFSATGNATNGSNVSELLSDYEQGTWTATLSCANSGAVTLLNNAGHYTRIGNICHVGAWVRVNGSTTGSASGNISMGGFPFPATNQGSYRGRIHITGYLMANISTGTWGWGVVEDDTSTFPLGYGQNAWNGFTAFAGTNIASTSAEFYVNGFYKVA
jgi:hypothetical protein